MSQKNGLLQIYSADLENSESQLSDYSPEHNTSSKAGANISGHSLLARDKTTLLVNWDDLHSKVSNLEEENSLLRTEATTRASDIELEERKELQLIHDCAKQLSKSSQENESEWKQVDVFFSKALASSRE